MPTFVLYRILGNDLPPLHRPGQTLDNLRFILAHEPALPGCEKRWVVNRIADRRVEREALALIRTAGHAAIHLPFDPAAYARRPLVVDRIRPDRFFHTPGFAAMKPVHRAMAIATSLEGRSRYAMNDNGARNAALAEGRSLADWVLPWDGACFLPARCFDAIAAAAAAAGDARYLIVPIARLDDNTAALDPAFAPEHFDEPQIAFGPGAIETFDEALADGASPKAALLARLDVAGNWRAWRPAMRAAERRGHSPDAGRHRTVGWVARLATGTADAAIDPAARYRTRLRATNGFLRRLDIAVLRAARPAAGPLIYDASALDRLRERWRLGEFRAAHVVMGLRILARENGHRPPARLIDRPAAASAGDPQDFRPADDDAARLWRAGNDALGLALAAWIVGERHHAETAAGIVRAWLVDPASRMNPHLRHAASDGAEDAAEGTAVGLVDARGVVSLLDAARMLELRGALAAADRTAIQGWVEAFSGWIANSAQGRAARAAAGSAGTWHDVLALACDAHLGRLSPVVAWLDGLAMRIAAQVRPDGAQVDETGRIRRGPEILRNLEAWCWIARIADGFGRDIRTPVTADGRSLGAATDWLRRQADPDDGAALHPKARARIDAVLAMLGTGAAAVPLPSGLPRSDPFAGVPPFWTVGLRDRTGGAQDRGFQAGEHPVTMVALSAAGESGGSGGPKIS